MKDAMWRRIFLLILLVLPVLATGCQRPLFKDDDALTDRKAKYFDGETVRGTKDARKASSTTGFGMPMGSGY